MLDMVFKGYFLTDFKVIICFKNILCNQSSFLFLKVKNNKNQTFVFVFEVILPKHPILEYTHL